MTREELEKLKQTIAYFGHWYDVIGKERVLILEKSIRYIEQLDKENEKLEGKLTKAEEIITNLITFDGDYKDDEEFQRKNELYDKIWEEAEQFLKGADE